MHRFYSDVFFSFLVITFWNIKNTSTLKVERIKKLDLLSTFHYYFNI